MNLLSFFMIGRDVANPHPCHLVSSLHSDHNQDWKSIRIPNNCLQFKSDSDFIADFSSHLEFNYNLDCSVSEAITPE